MNYGTAQSVGVLLMREREQMEEQKKALESALKLAKKKAKHAEAVTELDGYKDFQEWAEKATVIHPPVINTADDLVRFMVGALRVSGVKMAASYFEQVQKDPERIKQALEDMQDPSEIDDADWD